MNTVPHRAPKGKPHYVYTLAYPESMGGKVFYVGKGKGDRINYHEYQAQGKRPVDNRHKVNVIKQIWKQGERIVKTKLAYFATHEEAILYEIALIFFLPDLTNLSEGGDGSVGVRHPMSEHVRQILYEANKGRTHSEEEKRRRVEAREGFKHTEETKQLLSKKRLGTERTYIESEETKQQRSETRRKNGWLAHPDETRRIWKSQRLGISTHQHSPEALEKKRIASSEKSHTEEAKQKICESKIGLNMQSVEGIQEIHLNYWRLLRGFSQRELARIAHVSADTISEIENGRIPRMGVLQKLAQGLDITFDQLVVCVNREEH